MGRYYTNTGEFAKFHANANDTTTIFSIQMQMSKLHYVILTAIFIMADFSLLSLVPLVMMYMDYVGNQNQIISDFAKIFRDVYQQAIQSGWS